MGSGNYESQILEAIQILVDNAVSKANYDKTIQGTVSRCVDATIGKYIVKYQDSSFYAYSHNTETTYPSGTSVYVLVPGNDMSKDKSIIGTVDHLGPDYVSIIEGENGYEVTGVNTINADGTFGLCSYKNEDIKILYDRDNNVDLIGLDVFGFENYIKQSSSIICGATFKTALDSAQKYRGDYGIVFHLDFTDKSTGEVVTKSYIVNVDQMTGNPYNYTVASRQYGIFDVDGANFISVKQIYLFAYDFPNTAEGKENDIFVSKVELSAANALEKEAAATCALTFVTPQGTYFDEKDVDGDIRTLQAQIRIKGNAIDNESQNVDYYWFRENNDITAKSEKYNQYGGAGWECLNNYSVVQSETEDNEAVVQWTRSGYQYITKKADNVARETTYKCVAVYFDGTILSKTIVIYNYSSNYEITIKSDSGVAFNYDLGKPTLTCYVNGQEETSDVYDYVWSVINSSNQFSVLKETTTENEEYANAITQRDAILAKISAEQLLTAADSENLSLYNQIIDQYEYIMRVENNKIHNLKISAITNFSTYKCSVYKSGVFIGTASQIITNTEIANPSYTLVIENGNQVFKYNAKGISPVNGSNQNPQVIEPLSFTLYDEQGQKINHNVIKNIEWKVPAKDTLLDVSLVHGNGTKNEDGTKSYFTDPELNITIAPNYNATCDKNEIQLILTYNDKVISAKTNLTFVKEGENGTNGTDFVCKIIPNVIEEEIAPKYPVVTYNEYTQQYELNYTPKSSDKWFKVQLWHDGELIFEGTQTGDTIENKEAKVKWMMLQNKYGATVQDESNFTIDETTSAITFNITEFENPANIVKAIVKYNNVDYYATLPISLVRVVNDDYDVQIPDYSGFRYVMYTTDGQTPAFDNQPFELIVSQIVEGVKNDISQFSTSEFAVDYNWEVKGRVYYSNWQSESNLAINSLYKSKELRNQKYFKPIDIYNGLCVTNALVCNITRGEDKVASVHIPIHFYINRYGNAALNGWDGNSISLDEEGGIILAPQVGAGTKNDDNTFTGVFMGSVKEPGAEKEEHGLFGYNAGQRTITLNSEDGSARFGKAGAGQIIIDPTQDTAQLKSGDYVPAEYNSEGKLVKAGSGMLIDLTEPKIEFGSGKFSVDKDGNVIADSFATREQVEDLENSISHFSVKTHTDTILIPCTSDKKPIESKTYTIGFYGQFKGQPVTSFTEQLTSGSDTGIEAKLGDNCIIFTVDSSKAIQKDVNTYVIDFMYTDLTNIADIKNYGATKEIAIALAVQGKDGEKGADGSSGKGISSVTTLYLTSNISSGSNMEYYHWDGNIEGKEVIHNLLGEEGYSMYRVSDRIFTAEELTNQKFALRYPEGYEEWFDMYVDNYDEDGNVYVGGYYFIPGVLVIKNPVGDFANYPAGTYLFRPELDGEVMYVSSFTYYTEESIVIDMPGWTVYPQTPTAENKYLWSYEITEYTDGTSITTNPCIIGTFGEDGAPGKDGEKGDDGIGVQSIVEQYYLSTSNKAQEGGSWKTTQDAWSTGKYIWTRSEITWTDGNVTHTDPVLAEAINTANSTASSATSTANAATQAANQANQTAGEAKQEAAAATNTANTASQTANNAMTQLGTTNQELANLTTVVSNNYKDLQGQIDGAIATWFYDYEPNTPNTLPTSEWTTDTIKDQHLGDLFYIIDNEEKAGQCYRYAKIDNVYKWVIVEDVEVAKAIADAANAQATADGKATIFTGTTFANGATSPVNPQAGDLWMKSDKDGILTYVKQSNGAFAWVEYNKYTDDSLATEAKNTADTAKNTADTAKNTADSAKQTADSASQTATNAHNEVQNTVKQVDVEYYVASSETEVPTSSSNWTTDAPQWSAGKFIWSRQKMTFVDASKPAQYSEPARVTGATGKTGQDGKDGEDGLSAYQIAVAGGFKGTEAEWLASLVGKDGADGKDGTQGIQGPAGSDGKTSYLHIAYANSADGKTDFSTTVSTNKLYIGQYTDFTEADSTTPSKYSWTLIKGADGKDGQDGENGVGIASITNKYAVSASKDTAPTSWYDNPQTMTSTNKYLWNYEIITYTKGSPTETTPRIIGVYGDKGKDGSNGSNGSDGKGIVSITEYFKASSSKDTAPSGTWSQVPETIDATNKYLWSYEVITYTTGDPTETQKRVIGTYGEKGKDGSNGTSVTIASKIVEYALSTNGASAPTTGWDDEIPAVTNGKYLWTKTTVVYNTGEKTEALSVGYIGTNGTPGAQGEKGNGYVYIVGTQTASTASWTGTTDELTELTTGTQILYKLPYAGKSNVTLNLTLADGTQTGAKECYFVGTTRLGTQYAANATIALMYDGSVWRVVNPYTANPNTYDRILYNNNIKAATAITASTIIVGTEEGYKTAKAGVTFDIKYPVLWAVSAIAADKTGKNNYLSMPTCTLRNNLANATFTQYEMAYLIGSVENGIFTIGDAVFSTKPPREEYLPVEGDSDETLLAKEQKRKTTFFMPVGVLTTTYQIYFTNSAPELYKYGATGFELYSDVATEDLIVSTETQYCIGSSTSTPPAETDAGWAAGLVISNINTTEYLWSRIKNTKKSGEVFYSEYSCLVQAQKEMINQVVEYLLWNDDQVAPGENASYTYSYKEKDKDGKDVTISGTNQWSITKPSKNIPGYQHLWSRIHSIYKYTGATVESLVTSYSDYKVDTSWNQLFSLTDNLRADVEQILKDIQGGYVKIQNGSILIGDSESNPLHLIIMNHNGIAFFDNPEGTWPSAEKIENATSTWMIDGSLNMKDIAVTNLVASSIANQYLVLGNDNKNNADVSGDLDIYDRKGHIAFETILSSTEDYIEGFKVYKYVLSGTTMTPNGYIYLSREHGFREYDAEGKMLFGNNNGEFKSVRNNTEQQVISKTESSVTYGAQMVPMKITGAGDDLVHIGIAFLKL